MRISCLVTRFTAAQGIIKFRRKRALGTLALGEFVNRTVEILAQVNAARIKLQVIRSGRV